MDIKDSGKRRQFESGAVRDISEDKGRMDLLPLNQIATFSSFYSRNRFNYSELISDDFYPIILNHISRFIHFGTVDDLYHTLAEFVTSYYHRDSYSAILELSIHYQQGAKKYSERNWEKGINCHCYVDSALRHLTKLCRGDTDEPHARAFMWNIFGLLWTLEFKNELNDLPFNGKSQEE